MDDVSQGSKEMAQIQEGVMRLLRAVHRLRDRTAETKESKRAVAIAVRERLIQEGPAELDGKLRCQFQAEETGRSLEDGVSNSL